MRLKIGYVLMNQFARNKQDLKANMNKRRSNMSFWDTIGLNYNKTHKNRKRDYVCSQHNLIWTQTLQENLTMKVIK